MSCGTCPAAVTNSLRGRVAAELDKLLALKRATGLFDAATRDISNDVGADIDGAIEAIPVATVLSYLDLLAYFACPLTPIALGLELADIQALDPNVALSKVRDLRMADISIARLNYETALGQSSHVDVIRVGRRYANELLRLRFDEVSFAKAILICGAVLATCPEEYQTGPYALFIAEAQDFTFVGNVPNTLNPQAAGLVGRLLRAETKFKELREALN